MCIYSSINLLLTFFRSNKVAKKPKQTAQPKKKSGLDPKARVGGSGAHQPPPTTIQWLRRVDPPSTMTQKKMLSGRRRGRKEKESQQP